MPTYTVHEPPRRNGSAPDPQRFAFVRDGFHFWAFLLTPLWLLYRRLWLVFVCYLLIAAATEIIFMVLRLPSGTRVIIGLLIGLLVGLEAGTLRRWTYARNKWKTIGIVTGDDQEEAERRFFSEWVTRPAETKVESAPVAVVPMPSRRDPAAAGEVLGLFPQPERLT
jgi:hypothetical protein